MNKIGVIILNWKQPKLTIETVNSFLKIKTKKFVYHIYIINNNHEDDSSKIFKKKYKNNQYVSTINSDSNLGYAGGNNFGIKIALKENCDYLLIANNDLLFDENFLINLYQEITSNNKIGLVGPKIYFAKGHEFHKDRYSPSELGKIIWSAGGQMDWNNILGSNIGIDQYDQGQFDFSDHKLDFLSGACFLIKSNTLKKIGLFDEKYFMYLEDVDLCQKIIRNGFQLRCVPKSIIWHINSGSSSSGSSLHDYFITRNRLIFGFKYASFRTKIALIKESIKFLFTKNKWKKNGVIDFYSNNLNKGSWK